MRFTLGFVTTLLLFSSVAQGQQVCQVIEELPCPPVTTKACGDTECWIGNFDSYCPNNTTATRATGNTRTGFRPAFPGGAGSWSAVHSGTTHCSEEQNCDDCTPPVMVFEEVEDLITGEVIGVAASFKSFCKPDGDWEETGATWILLEAAGGGCNGAGLPVVPVPFGL